VDYASTLPDVLDQVKQSDLALEEKRVIAEREARKVLRAKASAENLSIGELVQKMVGQDAPTDESVSTPRQEVARDKPRQGAFPPPPSST